MLLTAWESLVERFFIFFPSRALTYTPRDVGLDFQEVFFASEDGVQLHGWYVKASDSAPVLLWCHGNGGNIGFEVENLAWLHQADLGIFIFDYRGYGLSQGRPSETGIYKDARGAYQYLRHSLAVPVHRIVLFGRSLGGAVAADLAGQVPARALILESTFTNVGDMAAYHFPWLPGKRRWSQKFDNRHKLAGLTLPKFFIHGEEDRVVPLWMGEQLYRLAQPPKDFYRIPGAGHEDTFQVGGQDYLQHLERFLKQLP